MQQTRTMPETTLVLPARHEHESIGKLLGLIRDAFRKQSFAVIIVDDSDDNLTGLAIGDYFANAGGVFVGTDRDMPTWRIGNMLVHHYYRMGENRWGNLAGAVIDGIERAGADTHIVVMDADGQHPPRTAVELLERLREGNDIAVASRYIPGGSNDGLDGLHRRFVSKAATLLTRILFPRGLRGVTDPMTGFFAFRRSEIDTNKLRDAQGFKILFELLASHPHTKRVEVPLQFQGRIDGESKAGEGNGLKFIRQLLRLRLQMMPELINFLMGGGLIAVVGALILAGLIDIGVEPHLANGIQLTVTVMLSFLFARQVIWRGSSGSRLHWQMITFGLTRGATMALSWFGFVGLMSLGERMGVLSVSWRAQAANLIMLVVGMFINYLTSKYLVFHGRTRKGTRLRDLDSSLLVGMGCTLLFVGFGIVMAAFIGFIPAVIVFIVCYSLFGTVTSFLEIRWRTYTRRTPEAREAVKFRRPKPGATQARRHTFILAALNEAGVIGYTVRRLLEQTYQNFEIIVTLVSTDTATIKAVQDVIDETADSRIRIIHRTYKKGSKPAQLNEALRHATGAFATPVDAETVVDPQYLELAEATLVETGADVLQGGVQLMNTDVTTPDYSKYENLPWIAYLFMKMCAYVWWAMRSWFCVHNLLEYKSWFDGRMSYQVDQGFVPLGGNTVTIRTALLREAGGWPINLTEDCALGVRLTTLFNAVVVAVYEAAFASREETPSHIFGPGGLIRQRTRWDQGFWSVLLEGEWLKLPTLRQRIMALYILAMPLIQAFNGVMLSLLVFGIVFITAPAPIVLVMFMPFLPMGLSIAIQWAALTEFGREFNVKIRWRHRFSLIVLNLPYQVILAIPAVIAIWRHYKNQTNWESTAHHGAHMGAVVAMNTAKKEKVAAGH